MIPAVTCFPAPLTTRAAGSFSPFPIAEILPFLISTSVSCKTPDFSLVQTVVFLINIVSDLGIVFCPYPLNGNITEPTSSDFTERFLLLTVSALASRVACQETHSPFPKVPVPNIEFPKKSPDSRVFLPWSLFALKVKLTNWSF